LLTTAISPVGQWSSPVHIGSSRLQSYRDRLSHEDQETMLWHALENGDEGNLYISPLRESINTKSHLLEQLNSSGKFNTQPCQSSPLRPMSRNVNHKLPLAQPSLSIVDDACDTNSMSSTDSLVYSSAGISPKPPNPTKTNLQYNVSPLPLNLSDSIDPHSNSFVDIERGQNSTVDVDKLFADSNAVDADKLFPLLPLPAPSTIVFKEKWREKEQRLREHSPVGLCPGWNLIPVIVKSNDDLRQEQLAAQAIRYMNTILTEAKVDCWLRPYDIIALSPDSGIIEAIPNTVSLDVLKRKEFGYSSLLDFFEQYFGPSDERRYTNAIENFIQSTAGYSIASYLLNLKDRHNGNILLTTHGHVVHIDFGFLLGRF
jgi:hypothetical protein